MTIIATPTKNRLHSITGQTDERFLRKVFTGKK
jgi:hypothetical protein